MHDMLAHLPEIVAEIREIRALAVPVDTELRALEKAMKDLQNNQFIETMTEYGCRRWEAMLGITPQDTDTLEDRRFRIRARFNEEPPYSRQVIKRKLDELCGRDGYVIEQNAEEYLFRIKIALTGKKQLAEVSELLERVLPANLQLAVELLYNSYQKLGARTCGELTAFTYAGLREEVIG